MSAYGYPLNYTSKTISPTCAALYGGTNLTTPLFVVPAYQGLELYETLPSSSSPHKARAQMPQESAGPAPADKIFPLLPPCYCYIFVTGAGVPNDTWSEQAAMLCVEANTSYIVVNIKLQLALTKQDAISSGSPVKAKPGWAAAVSMAVGTLGAMFI